MTCEDARHCPECGPSKRHWPGARYLKSFSPEFPHFEVGDDNLWRTEKHHWIAFLLRILLVFFQHPAWFISLETKETCSLLLFYINSEDARIFHQFTGTLDHS